nr:hypothetical protein [Tanacetum cinerariifolium]
MLVRGSDVPNEGICVEIKVGGRVVSARVVSRVVLGLVMKVVLVMLRGCEAFVRWFWMGELSLEEISMKSIRGIFFGGFWVEELALKAIGLLEFRGISSFDGWKLVYVGNMIKSIVVNVIILHPLVRSRRRRVRWLSIGRSWSWETRPFSLILESLDSFLGDKDHHMIHEIEVI